ncbi:MAG: FAD-dependent oxidoreductase [Phenylobacterium sp.]|uniref:FAD-dependent oxidoreductase n=1 Tax=Phenylobacterium sp. TaxID=1871053 RepID=UPI00391ABFF8
MSGEIVRLEARRRFLRGSAAAGGLGLLGLGGCAAARPGTALAGLASMDAVPPLAPVRAHADRIMKITVCLRPFRAQGPRLDVEQVGDKTVVHNYGHGGSGWSLSWGSSSIAVKKALAAGEREVGVIGCGALGLTSALLLQQAGVKTTIYAKELIPQTRSARATGTWSPDSRIALAKAAGPEFPALWEEMCRTSFAAYQTYLGLPGDPVVWSDRYTVSDLSPQEMRARRQEHDPIGFASYQERVRDLTPRSQLLAAGTHPFAAPYVQRNTSLQFNVAALGRRLMNDFLLAGGRIETREFHAPADLAALKEKTLVNCTGYGARALWKDESITPVRGQIAWLIPQAEVNYGVFYKNVTMLSRSDGVIIQDTGPDEGAGYGDANETPDRASAEAAVATIAELYSRSR